MFQLIISGKPKNFRAFEPVKGSKISASFILVEKRFVGGALIEQAWTVCVPQHKQTWAAAQCEKGYSIIVTANDFAARPNPDNPTESCILMIVLEDIKQI